MTVTGRKIRAAVEALKAGGSVIYPTETAYALGCDSRNAAAIRAIYRLKGRSDKKPFALIAADTRMVRRFFQMPNTTYQILTRHWPGPLTLILPVRDARLRRALGLRQVGVRVSPNQVASRLSALLGAPIVATSANRSGKGNCYSVASALRSLGLKIPDSRFQILALDAGTLPRLKPSTVVVFRNGKPVVIRKGPVAIPTPYAPRPTR